MAAGRDETGVAMAPNQFLDEGLGKLKSGAWGFADFAGSLWRRARETGRARPDLRRELRLARWVGALIALGVGAVVLASCPAGGCAAAPVALLVPPLTWIVLCAWVAVELGLVRHPLTGAPGTSIGPANFMTLFRGWAAAPVLILGLGTPGPSPVWVGLCLLAGITDLLDGTVALRLKQESRLGRLLDPVLDACFFTAAAVSLGRWGLLPAWVAVLVGLRYFLPVVGGLVLLFWLGRSLPVRHTPWGQLSTLATGVALLLTWLSTLAPIPTAVLLAAYALTVTTMALALAGIVRRAPLRPA